MLQIPTVTRRNSLCVKWTGEGVHPSLIVVVSRPGVMPGEVPPVLLLSGKGVRRVVVEHPGRRVVLQYH